ncbi:LAO/AO transport system kinase [Georgfuchsia toluolica]|uniref:LAO/AO transport system kinase n=1 Tax=Georgfuchsia toluolica TaxID=424218 RepID=A0A916J6Z4_9PROT|nr:methylmalonyl Co-A mutase-associated GTPase MeaB [Georgfuchsia toluolica]CAG4885155.1 LAO/AO transport system kinase [Georgfuchsia toluolica]
MGDSNQWQPLLEGALRREQFAVARLISFVEDRRAGWRDAMRAVFPLTGRAAVVGITGSPGAGKSTLTGCLATAFAGRGRKVAVVAVDPSSPFTGGAVLGDRIRMPALVEAGIYMRSIASRGALGGLSQSTRDAVRILDASGFDFILIETVGVGQDEIDIIRTAQQTVVVCAPGQGDSVQAAKAGLMEIADVFVVNKADRDGADKLMADLESMVSMGEHLQRVAPTLVSTVATSGKGVADLVRLLEERLPAGAGDRDQSGATVEAEIIALTETAWHELLWDELGLRAHLARRLQKAGNRVDPYAVAAELANIDVLRRILQTHPNGYHGRSALPSVNGETSVGTGKLLARSAKL